MPGNPALDMSLDDLIKKSKKKPGAPGAKKAGPTGKKPVTGQGKGKAGQKPQQQQQQKQQPKKAGANNRGVQQQKQPVQKQGLKVAKGSGIQKAGARPVAKAQQRPGQKRPDVRVVQRPAASRPPLRPVGRGMGRPQMAGRGMPRPEQRFMGPPGGFRGPQMMPMMQQPMMMPSMMMQQQPMMQPSSQMMQQQQQQPQQQETSNKWPSDLFDGSVVSSKTSAKLLVSNLDYKVTDEDITELFGTVGAVKESYIHFDKNGRSLGTATVVFVDRKDALTAFNRYNNVALDNKRMAIEVVEQAVPRGTFKTLSSGINVSRPQQAAAAGNGAYRGRGVPQGDMMME